MGKELLLVAEAVSNEKGVSKNVVFDAIQVAIESATKRKYSNNILVRVELDHNTGEYSSYRYWDVVEDDQVEEPELQITLSDAQVKQEDIKVGDKVEEPIASVKFGRISAQAAKQAIVRKVREAEREMIVEQYKEKEGELVTGVVKKTTRDFLLLDLGGNAEAMLSRSDMLPQDIYRPGDRIRTYLAKVELQPKGPQLFVNRTDKQMLIELFKIEVPEIGEDVIELKSAAREPGVRAKIAVKTNDGRIDPIGACVGMRGSRVQAVSSELGGERIDIVLWDDSPAQFVINAMSPAEVVSIVMDEETHTMDLAVREEQLSQAIGKGGQNVNLASQLTGWILNVMSEKELKEKNEQESNDITSLFMEKLDIEEDVAQVLVENKFSSIEEIAYVAADELNKIEGFDEDITKELQSRANDVLLTSALTKEEVLEKNNPEDDLLSLEGMERELAYKLAGHKIKTVEDLAELSVEELQELVDISSELAAELIMKAREPWFKESND